MNRDLDRRLLSLEQRQAISSRMAIHAGPVVYTIICEGGPRPNVDGPVYQLVGTVKQEHNNA